MISAACYSMVVYCENSGYARNLDQHDAMSMKHAFDLEGYQGFIEATHANRRMCLRDVRAAGWKVEKDGRAWCPKCRKSTGNSDRG